MNQQEAKRWFFDNLDKLGPKKAGEALQRYYKAYSQEIKVAAEEGKKEEKKAETGDWYKENKDLIDEYNSQPLKGGNA